MALKPPQPPTQQSRDARNNRTRQVLKAYLNAPIESRPEAARKARHSHLPPGIPGDKQNLNQQEAPPPNASPLGQV